MQTRGRGHANVNMTANLYGAAARPHHADALARPDRLLGDDNTA
jgi:hypothetical protein